MRVLALVLSCRRPPYDALREAQLRTWDSVQVDGVRTTYYFSDNVPGMTGRLGEALRDALREEPDYVFRTNSSSYVDKVLLHRWASRMPHDGCYAGIDGDGFASGSGFLLSRDLAEFLAERLPESSEGVVEDVVVGRILAEAGHPVTPGASRLDYWHERFLAGFRGQELDVGAIRRAYHVRCKAEGGADRTKDVVAMEDVHRIKFERG